MTVEQATKEYNEAHAVWVKALQREIRLGTETDADMRKLMAEMRIEEDVADRHREAIYALGQARAEYEARMADATERIAAAHEAGEARYEASKED